MIVTERYGHLAYTQWDAIRAAHTRKPVAKEWLAQPASYVLHADDTAAGAKIIDLASRRRSAG
ncbi:hypothetical protein [Saccharopolyspora taberi]|uniref:Uncharacterized protein n=1 Tax=Saccharopolyspora taberi TaxID=60895 RepID=A0ABN3VFG5_9PSEU